MIIIPYCNKRIYCSSRVHEKVVSPRRRNLKHHTYNEIKYFDVFASICHDILFKILFILMLNNAFEWPCPSLKNIITCLVRQETVKPLNCARAVREKGNHEVTRRARGTRVAGWALAHHHQQQPDYAYICMLFYFIDRRRGPRPRRSEVCWVDRRHQPRTVTVVSVYDDDTVAAFPGDVTDVCAILLARVEIPLLPPHGCSFCRGVSVVVFHFGDRPSLFILYKGSNILLFDPFCLFSRFSPFIIFYFHWSHYAFSNIILNAIFEGCV